MVRVVSSKGVVLMMLGSREGSPPWRESICGCGVTCRDGGFATSRADLAYIGGDASLLRGLRSGVWCLGGVDFVVDVEDDRLAGGRGMASSSTLCRFREFGIFSLPGRCGNDF